VVGHTLSINLLHVTAARHALQQHGDVSDAVESLVEAERVGRDAMGDLRRTVAVLRAPTVETQPLPGIDDVPALIEQCRAAGLDIRYTWDSSPKGMSDLTGLGIYRIVQESLANIAKHAPRSSASVTMTLQDDALGVHIANTLPADHRTSPPGQGSGLPGMAARAQQMGADLRAGAADGQWVVTVTAPVASS
jgi:signal transduction histidine kinase